MLSRFFYILWLRKIHIFILDPDASSLLLIYEEHENRNWYDGITGQEVEPIEVSKYPPVGAKANSNTDDDAEPGSIRKERRFIFQLVQSMPLFDPAFPESVMSHADSKPVVNACDSA